MKTRSTRPLTALFALGSLTFALHASAQTDAPPPLMAPPPPPVGAGPAGPGPMGAPPAPERFANIEATVTSYLLSPDAEVAGLMLDNGRQVNVPPHLGAQLADLVKPGQRVRVDNTAAVQQGMAPAPLTITSVASGRSLVDAPSAPGTMPPPPPAFRQGQAALQPMKASGTVKQVLAGPRGETRGVMLDNGTQVAIPPHAAPLLAGLFTAGARVNVEGYGRTSAYGTVVQATSVGRPGEAPVTMYAAPLPR